MIKNILVISTSLRNQSNSELLADSFIEGAKEAGHAVEKISLKDKNIGILITDHNVQETLSITDRAYLLFEGKILFQGTPEELAENKIVREKYLSNSFVLRRKDFQLNKDE